MYCVYVLKSKRNKSLYIGYTNNLRKRIEEHNAGRVSYTKNHLPWILVYCEVFRSEKDARRRESKLKQFKNSYSELKKRISESIANS